MRVVLALLAAVVLAACNQTKPDTSAATPVAPIDAKIAKVSQDLAKNCALLSTGIVLAQAFNKSQKLTPVLASAKLAQEDFCAHPPTDTATAIQLVAQAAVDISNALKEAH